MYVLRFFFCVLVTSLHSHYIALPLCTDIRKNPIAELDGCRSYVIFHLPQLQKLDDVPVETVDREAARVRWDRHEILECETRLKTAQADIERLEAQGDERARALDALEHKHANLKLTREVEKARLGELEPKLQRCATMVDFDAI